MVKILGRGFKSLPNLSFNPFEMKKIICFILAFVCFWNAAAAEEPEVVDYVGRVFMNAEFLDGDILKISVLASDMISPVLGIAFYLAYDGDKLAFLRYEPGQFLERGGDPFYLVQNNDVGKKIIFGETLRRDDSFPVGGDGIVDFYFQILVDEEFDFLFERGVISTLDVVRQDIAPILWEDLLVGREGEIPVSYKNNFTVNVSEGKDSLGFSSAVYVFLIIGIMGAGILLFIFLKKYGKKRPDASVNFK